MTILPIEPILKTFDISTALTGWSVQIDSGTPGCVWHRLQLDADIPASSQVTVSYYANDVASATPNFSNKVTFIGLTSDLETFIESAQGRYLTVRLDFPSAPPTLVLRMLSIYYPHLPYVRFLLSDAFSGWTVQKIDSGIPGCVWHRLRLDADIPASSQVTVSYFANDDASVTPVFTNAAIFSSTARDAYIESAQGRYLSVRLDFPSPAPVLRGLSIYYPRLSYMRFLPAVYAEDPAGSDMLERMVSLFESVLERSGETIDALPLLFNPQSTKPPLRGTDDDAVREWLGWLANMVSIDLYDQLKIKGGVDGNRCYIELASNFYRKKGTLDGLADLVTFLVNPQLYIDSRSQGSVTPTIVCKIKEHKNVLFRSWGLDHDDDKFMTDTLIGPNECIPFFRKCSRTFDNTKNSANVNSYDDTLHYVWGKNEHSEHFYASNVVCLYVFLTAGSSIVSKEALATIIRSYLPVFVDIEVIFIETTAEVYPSSPLKVTDSFLDDLSDGHLDAYSSENGVFTDHTSWQVLHANVNGETTNDIRYRVYHAEFDRPITL